MKLNKLKGKIVERGLTVEKLAAEIGVDKATLYRKLNDFDKFTIGEVMRIKEALSICDSEASDIFLSK